MSEKKSSISYIKIFIVVAALLIFCGVIFQLVNSYTKRVFLANSYNLLVISDKYIGVIGVDEDAKTLSSAIVSSDLATIRKENLMLQSVNFGIPIHGFVSFPEGSIVAPPGKSFFSLGNIQKINSNLDIKTKNISFFDWLRLYSIAKKVPDENLYIKNYRTIRDLNGLFSDENENMFRDSYISSNKTSLQIINGTNVNGLGTKIANMYSRMGFNVVSVLTETGIDDSRIIYYDDDSFDDATLVQRSFDFPMMHDTSYNVAAVTLIIGEDSELLLESTAY